MRRLGSAVAALGIVVLALMAVSATAEEEAAQPAGHEAFQNLKCNMCHAVSTVGIEAKTKSEKMQGPDLVGLGEKWDAKALAAYMNKDIDKDGKQHKKEFKGTDEELQALVDWLLEQKAEG
jgi:cytochrome c553